MIVGESERRPTTTIDSAEIGVEAREETDGIVMQMGDMTLGETVIEIGTTMIATDGIGAGIGIGETMEALIEGGGTRILFKFGLESGVEVPPADWYCGHTWNTYRLIRSV